MTEGIASGGGRIHSNSEYSIPLRTQCELKFENVVTKESLYNAWNDFIRGKRKRPDGNAFGARLADNIDDLYQELISNSYTHGPYEEYVICDPKKRAIHKAPVGDRVVHRLLYNALYPYFDRRFIHDSYSCRNGKGTHRARARFRSYVHTVSKNYTKQCYVLKFDIKQCFASIDQNVLKKLLASHIYDSRLLRLCEIIIDSFPSGLPLGNLTSQLFINIYLHELDHFVKHFLNASYYSRYADDVVIVGTDPEGLASIFAEINHFLQESLRLTAHKISIRSLYGGVDVLGEVFFEKYERLRRSTGRRILLREIRDSVRR
jgi:retron-type reverse transcriptase